ncbi:hypothetical protein RB595_009925 [Gaeumannomyces hyphopodioides]
MLDPVPLTEKIGEAGLIPFPHDSIYFTCPPERKYLFSKIGVEAWGMMYKPRPLWLDENGFKPVRFGTLSSSNEAVWRQANSYRQVYPLEAAQVKTVPQTYEDLYDYFDGYDLYFLGVHNALNLIQTLIKQNKLLDPFLQKEKRAKMNEFLDEWLAADPEAEDRLLSWNWQADPSARTVLDGCDMVPDLGHVEDEDKLLLSTLIAERCEKARLAREARYPIVVNGSGDDSLGNWSSSQPFNGGGILCQDSDSANAGAPTPLPADTAGPISSAPFGAGMPMMTTAEVPMVTTAEIPVMTAAEAPMATAATSVSAPKYVFNGSYSVKVSRPAQSSQNRLPTDDKHPSATSFSPQGYRMRHKLSYENKQMAGGLGIGGPEFGFPNGQSPNKESATKPARHGVHDGGFQYHGGHNPEATPTKPSRHAPVHGPPGQMVGGQMVSNPFSSQGHVGFNNQASMPHGIPQPGFVHQSAGRQGGVGRDFSAAAGMPAPSPNQGLHTAGFHGDMHSRAAPNYQQASPPRHQMPGQFQQTSPSHSRVPGHLQQAPNTRFTDSQHTASGSGPSTKDCPPGNGAGWALSEQQDSIHGQKFVYNKTNTNTSGGPKPRRDSTLSTQSPGARKQQAGNGKPAAIATAHQDTKHPNKNGGGNGYVRPPPPTKETCLNFSLSNREPAVECPCPTCLHRSRNVTVTAMGGGSLDRGDEGALRKHFAQWGQIECVIFPRPSAFQLGFQGGQHKLSSRAYVTYVFYPV